MVYSTERGYRFRIDCVDADSVSLLGDFNDWSTTSHPMTSTGGGTWELAVDVTGGSHRFAYFVLVAKRDDAGDRTGALASLLLEETVDAPLPPARMAC